MIFLLSATFSVNSPSSRYRSALSQRVVSCCTLAHPIKLVVWPKDVKCLLLLCRMKGLFPIM